MDSYIGIKVLKELRRVRKQNKDILKLLREFEMSVSKDIQDLSQKIDDATNVIASEITDLRSQVKNSMTDEEVADIKARLGATADRLTALGKDPNNPVPPAP